MPQWVIKSILIAFYVVPAIWVLYLALSFSWRVARSDYVTLSWLNPFLVGERYVAEQLQGKMRVTDAIYQDEMIVARVRGEPEIDEEGGTIVFRELIRSENLETSRTFIFRRWELRLTTPPPQFSAYAAGGTYRVGQDGVELPEHHGRVLTQVRCKIVKGVL